jgi:hypothetical protein
MTGIERIERTCALAFLAASLSLIARARAADPPSEPAAEETAKEVVKEPAKDSPATPPTIDELLGIGGEKPETAADEPVSESEDELQRRLDEENLGNAFTQAIGKMVLSADRLDERFDTGLETQRIQEDILSQLDQLIEMAKNAPCKGGSSSSSSSSASSKSGSKQASRPGKRSESQRAPKGGDNQGREGDPPPMREGELNPVLDKSRSEWGALPARVRDQFLQGRREKFSSLYDQLTKEYYRRLAEEGR